ncbi:FMN-dependent NADH-azoreductase [Ureibacillus sp. FSL K6-3587]|jgi:FMN-dependent NADH-azoreductase|uniref:FMN dependent NADH:quinone oxidoreductase n=1 Tax=Ureibacillus suwonensis TaxID=313007 RepID=A0ABW0RFQ9_9BACL
MKNVLVIKANNRPDGISTKMFETYIEEAKKVEDINLKIYNVFEEDMPYFGQQLFDALAKQSEGKALTESEARLLAAKKKAMDLVTEAEIIVLAFPLWNLTIPAPLHTFIDYIYQAGFMFKYNEQGQLVQLLTDKKFVILNARGGYYSSPEAQPMEMSVNYIKNVLGNIAGMELLDEVIIEGHNAEPNRANEIIEEGLKRVKGSAQKLAAVTV